MGTELQIHASQAQMYLWVYSLTQAVLDSIPTDTFILEIVYEHNGNILLEY
jgi:hypothetical protein